MRFANKEHSCRFEIMLKRDNTKEGDTEREAFFYLISYDESLYDEADALYDFSKRQAKVRSYDGESWRERIEDNPKYTHEQKTILKLAYILLGDFLINTLGLYQIFKVWADGENAVMLTAISLRFNLLYEMSLISTISNEYFDHYLYFD